MNKTFDVKDMNISLNAFGAVIKAEGQAVSYDSEEHEVRETCEYETEVQIDGAEEVNE